MKSLIIFTLSLLLAFPPQVFALSLDQQSRMKEFLEITEITKREVPLRELYGKFEEALPENIRAPFREYLTLNPNAVLPKFSISKVLGENGEQDIQLSFADKGKGSGTVRLAGHGKVAAQAGEIKISTSDIENPLTVIGKIEQAFPAAKYSKPAIKVKNFGLLSAKQINSLTIDERRQYFRSLQQLLAAMEKAESSQLARQNRKTSASDYFFSSLLPMAWAASSKHNNEAVKAIHVNDNRNSCIYAGHVTNYGYKVEGATVQPSDRVAGHYACGGDSSSFKAESFRCKSSPTQIQCNGDVYGTDPEICVPEKSLDATAKCNDRATQYDAFPKTEIKNKSEFDALKQKVVEKLKSQEATCLQVTKDPGLRLEDQFSTCTTLLNRIEEIKAVSCESLAQNSKDRFKELKCVVQGGSQNPGTGGTAGPGTAPGGNPGTGAAPNCGADSPNKAGCPTTGGTAGPATGGGSGPATSAGNPGSLKCDPKLYSKEPDFVKQVNGSCASSGGNVADCTDDTPEKSKWVQCLCGSNPIGKTPAPNGRTYYCEKPPITTTATKGAADTLKKLPWQTIGITAAIVLGMYLVNKDFKKRMSALTPSPTATYVESTTTVQPHYRGSQ